MAIYFPSILDNLVNPDNTYTDVGLLYGALALFADGQELSDVIKDKYKNTYNVGKYLGDFADTHKFDFQYILDFTNDLTYLEKFILFYGYVSKYSLAKTVKMPVYQEIDKTDEYAYGQYLELNYYLTIGSNMLHCELK